MSSLEPNLYLLIAFATPSRVLAHLLHIGGSEQSTAPPNRHQEVLSACVLVHILQSGNYFHLGNAVFQSLKRGIL